MNAKNLVIICPISITDACLAAMGVEIVRRPNLDRLGALRCMSPNLAPILRAGQVIEMVRYRGWIALGRR